MLTVAHDYCKTITRADKLSKKDLINYLTKVSPLLYLKGALLPEVKVQNPEFNEKFVTEEDWESLFNDLRKVFGKDDEFWHVNYESETEMKKGSLSEHLTDLFQDLNDFMILYQKSSLPAKENAVSELFRLFVEDWGPKVIRIQQVLHTLNYSPQQEPEGFNIPDLF